MIDAEECRRQAASCEIEALTEDQDEVRTILVEMAQHWTELANRKDQLQSILSKAGRTPHRRHATRAGP